MLRFWDDIQNRVSIDGWAAGKPFEYAILRAFELEGADVRWPYSVELFETVVEQIDGVIHLPSHNLSIIAEMKDHSSTINIEPIAKLRAQLMRRPANTIGSVFISNTFTEPASILARFLAPQTILLWEKDHIDYCF